MLTLSKKKKAHRRNSMIFRHSSLPFHSIKLYFCVMAFSFYNRDVMALPNLKACVYSALGGSEIEILEAKLNIMETIFLVLQIISDSNDSVHKGQYMYRTLMDKHFNSAMEVMVTFSFGCIVSNLYNKS